MGRWQKGNYQPRTIDIDIMFFGNKVVETDELQIPHPRIPIRRFVLVPLCDIAKDFIHPQLNRTIEELLKECEDQLSVLPYDPKSGLD